MSGIGTLGEHSLHAALKWYYEPTGDFHEVRVGRFIADIMRDGEIIEIQTQGLDRLRRKLEAFLPEYKVTVVCPVAHKKTLETIDEQTGEVLRRRKSPLRGTIHSVFPELYKIKPFLKNENLRFRIILLEVEERRFLTRRNRKGYSRVDTMPREIAGELAINSICDYCKFITPALGDEFTSADYALAAGIDRPLAQTALNVLRSVGTVEITGKSGNSYIYTECKAV